MNYTLINRTCTVKICFQFNGYDFTKTIYRIQRYPMKFIGIIFITASIFAFNETGQINNNKNRQTGSSQQWRRWVALAVYGI
jgi:uncharacterized membrane protein (DUF441 family)